MSRIPKPGGSQLPTRRVCPASKSSIPTSSTTSIPGPRQAPTTRIPAPGTTPGTCPGAGGGGQSRLQPPRQSYARQPVPRPSTSAQGRPSLPPSRAPAQPNVSRAGAPCGGRPSTGPGGGRQGLIPPRVSYSKTSNSSIDAEGRHVESTQMTRRTVKPAAPEGRSSGQFGKGLPTGQRPCPGAASAAQQRSMSLGVSRPAPPSGKPKMVTSKTSRGSIDPCTGATIRTKTVSRKTIKPPPPPPPPPRSSPQAQQRSPCPPCAPQPPVCPAAQRSPSRGGQVAQRSPGGSPQRQIMRSSSIESIDSSGRMYQRQNMSRQTSPAGRQNIPLQAGVDFSVYGGGSPGYFDQTAASPCRSQGSGGRNVSVLSASPPSVLETSQLQMSVQEELMNRSLMAEGSPVRAQGSTRAVATAVPMIMTPKGPRPVQKQMILEKKLERGREGDHISRHLTDISTSCAGARMKELNIQDMQPGSLPKHGAVPREVIAVTSTLSFTPEYTQAVKTVVRDTTREGLMDAEVAQLVEEELREFEEASRLQPPEIKAPDAPNYPIQKKVHEARATPESMSQLHRSIAPGPSDEAEEDMQPEVVAALMHTEEKGLSMGLAPNQLYDYLFPDQDDDQLIGISSAAPAPLQDVVVPTSVPSELHRTYLNAELQQAALATQVTATKPVDSIYSESVLTKEHQVPCLANTATRPKKKKKKKVEPLIAELPPWGTDVDLQPMIDLVGASPNNTLVASEYGQDPEKMFPGAGAGLEYILKPQPPRHVSRIQLRGSLNPGWFPGYVVALPTYQDVVKILRTPDTVLGNAWRAVQPHIYPEHSIYTA